MDKDLSELLICSEWGITKDVVEVIFKKIKPETQEELNVKSALLKQSFLNQFELSFEKEFLNASEKLLEKTNSDLTNLNLKKYM